MTAHLRRLLCSVAVALAAILPTQSYAQRRSLMEGLASGANAILVSTAPARVYMSTTAYGGAVSNVAVFTSSNIVLSDTAAGDKVVIYSTGTVKTTTLMFADGTTQTAAAASASTTAEWQFLSSATVSAVTSVSIALTTTPVRVEFNFTQNTSAANYIVRFNADTDADYAYVAFGANTAGSGVTSANTAQTGCMVNEIINSVLATGGISGKFDAYSSAADSYRIHYSGTAEHRETSTHSWVGTIGCWYAGSAALSAVSITVSAGTMTGEIYVRKRNN